MKILKDLSILALYALIILLVVAGVLLIKNQSNERPARIADPRTAQAEARFYQLVKLFDNWTKDSNAPASLNQFIGTEINLLGAGAPPGGSNDLLTENELYVRIVTKNNQDMRPMAVLWEAEVTGKVKSINWSTKTITLMVEPNDYQVGATW